ncbi:MULTISPECIES: [Fe-Fe] hydrogenase large subunit C-terminal domain-containing protein [unclassified Thermosipho (in: thermotogales)]|uniref:[Fe-Fe] hydrogenase large subunit C-terminal domain-containing protein n=1 Tax=unclassified Thermosipho (in: thermotogales) TaxID=2676525 RepID=UPI0009859E5C|nr:MULTISPECIES: [Fe-Fe] hydrogenase large subunit C-terminal domain-containing protein [unclassified Thermosipho (in: thermotogales)]MBT1247154.1 ferredoxin [Thermosipho sp. 1244]OOC47093.1 ferredoxin [Thermosipho sp. 1223]
MKEYIISNEADCKYCYKCLRHCPVKAISFSENSSKVIPEECVICGKCVEICPQDAKNYVYDAPRLRQFFDETFLVSIAPSFFAHFEEPFKVIGFLKEKGAIVSETSIGAEFVSKEYKRLYEKQSIITTSCPVIVELVEKYYPEFIKYLAPVVSPAIAHARFLKEKFGNFPLVFIGPCIAKKKELEEEYDLVLTFEEFEKFILSENINLFEFKEMLPDPPYPGKARYYPITGGIINTVDGDFSNFITIDGIENVAKFFETGIPQNEKFFVEMSACSGSCIEGPGITKEISILDKKERIAVAIKKLSGDVETLDVENYSLDLKRTFEKKKKDAKFTEEQIKKVLISIGKTDPSKELDCGACGYNTCREKAIAVLEGKAEKEMCVTYLVEKVSSVSNMVVEETPNIIIIYKDGKITFKNRMARVLFMSYSNNELYKLIQEILEVKKPICDVTVRGKRYSFYKKKFSLPEDSGDVLMLIDITKQMKQEEKIRQLKRETIEKIEEVLNKQMHLAQEIAGLLGESIAETKTRFMEFKKFMEEENDNL